MKKCPKCQSEEIVGVEYSYDMPEYYDGISEWNCRECGYRQGRWSGKELKGKELDMEKGNKNARKVPKTA